MIYYCWYRNGDPAAPPSAATRVNGCTLSPRWCIIKGGIRSPRFGAAASPFQRRLQTQGESLSGFFFDPAAECPELKRPS